MIKDKQSGDVVSGNSTNERYKENYIQEDDTIEEEYIVDDDISPNGIIDVFKAIKEILGTVTWHYKSDGTDLIFKTIKFNHNQYESIVSGDSNVQGEIGFPAALINFINMRWTSQQKYINQGQAELRIQILLNTLNNDDDDKETEGFYVCQRVHQTILDNVSNYECLQKYLKLTFMDSATSFHSGLQSWWLTYDIKFTEVNILTKRRTVQRYIVTPPFTNHSDQAPTTPQIFNHTNLDHADETYDKHTSFETEFD